MKLKSILGAVALFGASAAMAVPVTVNYTDGTSYNTSGLSSYTTGAGDMNGMEITAYFSDGSSDTAIMGNTTAAGTGWSTTFSSATTWSDPFNVSVSNTSGLLITGLSFSGKDGDTVFDAITDPVLSPGSARGNAIYDVSYTGSTVTSIDATYTNKVSVNGTFYGDLYETLNLDFTDGLASGDTLSFVTDTDNLEIDGDLTPVDVPEPASLFLLGLGLMGTAAARRRAK